jgi:hypothetical protein
MVRRLRSVALLLFFAFPVWGHPAFIPMDPPTTLVEGGAGRSSIQATVGAGALGLSIARSIGPRIDVVATASRGSLFDLSIRTLWVRNLLPVRVETEVARGRATVLTTLLLGPVHVSFGRSWQSVGGRSWAALRLASRADFFLAIELEFVGGRFKPSAGFTWLPFANRLIGLNCVITANGPRISLGSVW